MKLATIKLQNKECAAIVCEQGIVPISVVNEQENKKWSTELLQILQLGQLVEIQAWYEGEGRGKLLPSLAVEEVCFVPLYRQPNKILGVGMNYIEKAMELSGKPPEEEPVIFMKPSTSLIGSGEAILLPNQSNQVTAEAELGIIIGAVCRNITEDEAAGAIAGFTATLDMTAKDIHARNPRYLQRAKSFDTFFSFGPYLLTADELPQLDQVVVETVLNGEVRHHNVVANMMYKPSWLVSFLSHIMTLQPGDIIMTGTPGSVTIHQNDIAECRIAGVVSLKNPVFL